MTKNTLLLSYFFYFFYPVFIVFRYKKLRAALAMERTKPINQNFKTIESNFLFPLRMEKISASKPFADYFRTKYKI